MKSLAGKGAAILGVAGWLLCAAGAASAGQGTASGSLTAQDRADILQLSAKYVETLRGCQAAAFAALFTPDGYFDSGFRGKMVGDAGLTNLIKTERHCTGATQSSSLPVPSVTITPTAQGATGMAMLPNDIGAYEDLYVKTAQGWRFKSRTFRTSKELASRGAGAAAPAK